MKILHIIREFTESGTADTIIEDHKNTGNDVTVVRMKQDKDYAKLVDLIFSSDKVASW
jgi:hypothetical protein